MTTAGYIIERVYVVTANHDPYGCGCDCLHAVCATREIAERVAKEYADSDTMIQTFIEEVTVLTNDEPTTVTTQETK